jgi:uncharacterized membrane protein YqiK
MIINIILLFINLFITLVSSQIRTNGIFVENTIIVYLNDTNFDNLTLNAEGYNNWLIMFYV